MVNELDVGFENYIIFHRGIREVYIEPNDSENPRHLHVIYQDGYDQDMGNPYGDYVQTAQDAAIEAKGLVMGQNPDGTDVDSESDYYHNNAKYFYNQATSAASDALQSKTSAASSEQNALSYKNSAEQALESIDTTIENIEGVSVEGQSAYIDLEAVPNAENIVRGWVGGSLDNVDGLGYDEDNAKYYVDFTDYMDEQTSKDYVLNTIAGIEGVERELGTDNFSVSYPFEAIPNSAIDDLFVGMTV